jgi:hypothetical protein
VSVTKGRFYEGGQSNSDVSQLMRVDPTTSWSRCHEPFRLSLSGTERYSMGANCVHNVRTEGAISDPSADRFDAIFSCDGTPPTTECAGKLKRQEILADGEMSQLGRVPPMMYANIGGTPWPKEDATVEINLSTEERATLELWARWHSSSQALALRSKIVLACAARRATHAEIAAELRQRLRLANESHALPKPPAKDGAVCPISVCDSP